MIFEFRLSTRFSFEFWISRRFSFEFWTSRCFIFEFKISRCCKLSSKIIKILIFKLKLSRHPTFNNKTSSCILSLYNYVITWKTMRTCTSYINSEIFLFEKKIELCLNGKFFRFRFDSIYTSWIFKKPQMKRLWKLSSCFIYSRSELINVIILTVCMMWTLTLLLPRQYTIYILVAVSLLCWSHGF